MFPDYGFLKSFECLCYPFLRPYNNNKLEYRSLPCVFLGYSSKHNRYVIFDESLFPYLAHSKPSVLSDSPSSDLVSSLLQQVVVSCSSQPISPGSSGESSLSLDANPSPSLSSQNVASSPVVTTFAGETITCHTSTSSSGSAPAIPLAPQTRPSSASGSPPSSPPPPLPYPNAPSWFCAPDKSSHSPTSPRRKKLLFFTPTCVSHTLLFISKPLRCSKLQSSTTLSATPRFSSSSEKGHPRKPVSRLRKATVSPFMSSYPRNRILEGISRLNFLYPRMWSQKGPTSLIPLQKKSSTSSKSRYPSPPWALSPLEKYQYEMSMLRGSRHRYTIFHPESPRVEAWMWVENSLEEAGEASSFARPGSLHTFISKKGMSSGPAVASSSGPRLKREKARALSQVVPALGAVTRRTSESSGR
ncbi:hypothetical protein V2J09_013127 [Rumex salicifolius]